jgi:hypothetical protein
VWTKVSYKRSRPTHEEEGTQREDKHAKESEYWLHPTPTSNLYNALQEEDNDQQQQKVDPANTAKPPLIYVSGVITISPLIQLLEQTVEKQHELKALQNNQVKIQPRNSDSYRTIVKALTEKGTEFHTYKPTEERNYKVVLKYMHYSINP